MIVVLSIGDSLVLLFERWIRALKCSVEPRITRNDTDELQITSARIIECGVVNQDYGERLGVSPPCGLLRYTCPDENMEV